MKITLTFDSVDELDAFRKAPSGLRFAETPEKAAELPQTPWNPEEDAEPTNAEEAPAAAKPAREAKKKTPAPTAEETKEPLTIRDIRKPLSDLNAKCGRNRATEIIREIVGKDVMLTDVDPSFFGKILAAAEEELSHAE